MAIQQLISELRRRQVIRATSIYAGFAWLLIGIGDVTFPMLGAPAWLLPALLWSALAGLPIVILASWFYGQIEPLESNDVISQPGRSFWDLAIISVLLGALVISVSLNLSDLNNKTAIGGVDGQRVAISALQDASPGGDYDWLALGLTSELRQQLSVYDSLTLLPKALTEDLTLAALAERADTLLEGTVQVIEQTVEVQLQATHLSTGRVAWTSSFSDNSSDLRKVQRRIASEIAHYFKGTTDYTSHGPTKPEAYAPYLKVLRYSAGGSQDERAFWLEETLKADPDWLFGWGELTELYFRLALVLADWTYVDKAEKAIDKMVELGLNRSDKNQINVQLNTYFRGQYRAAERHYRETESIGSYWYLMLNSGLLPDVATFYQDDAKRYPHSTVWDVLSMLALYEGDFENAAAFSERCSRYGAKQSYFCHNGMATALPKVDKERALELLAELQATVPKLVDQRANQKVARQRIRQLQYGLAFEADDMKKAAAVALAEQDNNPFRAAVWLLNAEDDRGEAILRELIAEPDPAQSITNARIRFYFFYAIAGVPERLRQHPLIREYLATLGLSDEWRLELCQVANQWPKDSGISCDPAPYQDILDQQKYP